MSFLKSLLFYPLLWLRGLFIGVGRILSGLCLIGTIVLVIAKLATSGNAADISWLKVLMPALMGFAIFMLMEFYDQILLKLNPTDSELILYK